MIESGQRDPFVLIDVHRARVAIEARFCEHIDMFVIELIYKAGLDDIDAHMPEHMKFLRKHYAAGTFVVSGRKVPREGGIILAVGESRTEIEAIARQDPFVTHGLADVRVIEFRVSQKAEDIQARIERV